MCCHEFYGETVEVYMHLNLSIYPYIIKYIFRNYQAMTSHYDTIQGPYDYCRLTSIAFIERENVQTIIAPLLETGNANVLELACGSGFYTLPLLEWGANSVVAVDASAVMLEAARRRVEKSLVNNELWSRKSCRFAQADCSIPTPHYLNDIQQTDDTDRRFDLVFAAWLLNYAPDRSTLVDMFRNIAMNLKTGGHFVGVTLPPSQDPLSSMKAEATSRPPPVGSGLLNCSLIEHVEDGIFFHVEGNTPIGNVTFDNYHLKKEVIESSARAAGLNGKLVWHLTIVPERYLRGEGPGGTSMEELKSYVTVPDYGILVAEKC